MVQGSINVSKENASPLCIYTKGLVIHHAIVPRLLTYPSEKYVSQKDCEKRQRVGLFKMTRKACFLMGRRKIQVEQYSSFIG